MSLQLGVSRKQDSWNEYSVHDGVRTIEGIQNDYPYKNHKNHGVRCCFRFRYNHRLQYRLFLARGKITGVASSDKNALMFLGMDRDVNLKGICFAMTKQSSSIVPLVDITATTDNGRFTMHGLRPNVSDTKEVACSFGSEASDFLTGISKSTAVNVKLDFNGEIRNYSFDTTEFGKMLTANGKGLWEKAAKDYAQGVRAPVFYSSGSEAPKNNAVTSNVDTHSYKASDEKLNSVWKSLSPETRKRLLLLKENG